MSSFHISMIVLFCFLYFFFFNDTATTEIYTLSLHDALPIPDDATRAPPGPAALAAVGPTSERADRARPLGRALCVLGGAPGATSARRVVRRRAGGARPRAQRSAPQPVGRLSLQRPHGAAPRAHPRVSAAPVVWDSRMGGPAAAPASLGLVVRPPGDTPARGGPALFRADHPVAFPAILRGGAGAPSAAHRPAPRVHRNGGNHVVARAVARAGAAESELPYPAGISLLAGLSDVARRRDDHPRGGRAVSLLHDGAAGVGPRAARGPAAGRSVDVGGGDDLPVGRDERGVVPVECRGRARRRGTGRAAGCLLVILAIVPG